MSSTQVDYDETTTALNNRQLRKAAISAKSLRTRLRNNEAKPVGGPFADVPDNLDRAVAGLAKILEQNNRYLRT